MKKCLILLIISLLSINVVNAQNLDSARIYINPGHGGHDSNDRFIAETGFWESESNLTKGLKLRDILQNYNALIEMSRTLNRTQDDLPLSQIVNLANNSFGGLGADFFHSIHSNGFQGTANYTLMLYNEVVSNSDAIAMCNIMGQDIYEDHRTSTNYVRGDLSFLGFTLGVLNGLSSNIPGTLSEGSFHDYIPESWRLQNLDYRKHESWSIARAFLEYFSAGPFQYGAIAGLVRDSQRSAGWSNVVSSGANDGNLPVNNITVTLTPGNLIYNGGNFNNGFFIFDSLMPGTYDLIYDAPGYYMDSTFSVTVTANQTAFADKNLDPDTTFIFPPETPDYIKVINGNDSTLIVSCEPAFQATQYIAYVSMDGITFTDTAISSTNNIAVNNLAENTVYYFKVRAANDSGASAIAQDLYAGVPSSSPNEVLVIDGFDRSTNTTHDYVTKVANPISQRGYAFSFALNESVIDGKISLNDFETVIWIIGDESTIDETFDPVEQDSIESFLQNGGKLFVSGAEIGWDLGRAHSRSDPGDQDFYHNFLKAEYVDDAPNGLQGIYYSCEAIVGQIFDGISDFTFDNGTHGTVNIDWPDAINGINGGQNILRYKVAPTKNIAGVKFEGLFPQGTADGKLIYLALPFETIYPEANRIEVMAKVFDFFEAPVNGIQEKNQLNPQVFTLFQNYPNPFNPVTTLSFNLPESGKTKLVIYNLLGQKIITLLNEDMTQGFYKVNWDASKYAGGMYYYTLISGNYNSTKKMLLLK
jgi:N-acetylmuramoyl-L-alanine amidase